MPSEKRQRQDEGRLNRRVAQVQASKRDQRKKTGRNVAIAVVALLAIAFLISLKGKGDDNETATGDSSTTSSAPETASTVQVAYPGTGKAITGDTPCPKADGSSERTTSFAKPPPTCIDAAKSYTATITTSEGDIVIALDAAKAPVAVNNFVVLARYHFYDGVPFHRIIPGFMDQAGTPVDQAGPDITKTPGYTIPDELPDTTGLASPADAYPEGTLAMANTGQPNTGGSQWFIVIGTGGQSFATNATYSVFGHVSSGIEVAQAINQDGDAATNGTPTKKITITSVTISES